MRPSLEAVPQTAHYVLPALRCAYAQRQPHRCFPGGTQSSLPRHFLRVRYRWRLGPL